jgi:leader peptidase (prepilin peptidase)/N-methyltransferase
VLTQYTAFFEHFFWAFLLCVTVVGLVVGSFLNVVIYRLPVMMQRDRQRDCLERLGQPAESADHAPFNLAEPRSRCGHCGHQITALENIPLISYLVLGGRCAACKTPISLQYPLVELSTGLVSLWVAWQFGVSLQTMMALVLTWCLIAASGIAMGHKLLPDAITLSLMWLGIFLALFDLFADLESSVIGAMAGYLGLWSVHLVFKRVTGKEGLGHGDFKLFAALGAWLGWEMLPVVILISSLLAAVVGVATILARRSNRFTQIPFGPYLAAAGWIGLLYGETLNRWTVSSL